MNLVSKQVIGKADGRAALRKLAQMRCAAWNTQQVLVQVYGIYFRRMDKPQLYFIILYRCKLNVMKYILFIFMIAFTEYTSATSLDPWYIKLEFGLTDSSGGQTCAFFGADPTAVLQNALDCLVAKINANNAATGTSQVDSYKVDSCAPSIYIDDGIFSGGVVYCSATHSYVFNGVEYVYPPDAGGSFALSQCSIGTHWYSAGWECLPYIDFYHHREPPRTCPPRLPKISDPMSPLTGSRQHELDLGVGVGGVELKALYDSVEMVGSTSAAATWVTPPPPSFGGIWQSNIHKRIGSSFSGLGYATSQIVGGGLPRTTAAVGSNGCGTGNASANDRLQIGTADRGLKLTYTADGRIFLFDGNALALQVFANNGGSPASIDIKTAFSIDGKYTSYSYSGGLLSSVTDQFGRQINFTYDFPVNFPARISSLVGSDGARVGLEYDSHSNLAAVVWPDSSRMTFLYERIDIPWALTGILDEGGSQGLPNRSATFTYDANGLVATSSLGSDKETYSIEYQSPPQWSIQESLIGGNGTQAICRDHSWIPASGVAVTLPNLQTTVMGSSAFDGMVGLTSQSQAAGSGCSASTSSMGYDANYNVVSKVDFNGIRTCYNYDTTRDLRVVALDGLPATKACPEDLSIYSPSAADAAYPERKISTEWYPNWAIKTREAEPKKITTWVYNWQPDPIEGGTAVCAPTTATLPDGEPILVLCTRYEQATTDATGALGVAATVTGATRKWSYTYNQYGQVLTETTPKLSATDTLSHTTTYVYYGDTSLSGGAGHTLGDLNTVTNPLGQVTTYTSYDAAGRLLSSTDANGTVTSQTYWPRGWLKSQTVTPAAGGGAVQTTAYAYWPTGLLQTVTLPDSSTLNYAYDDAHRLTDVTDGAGNKLHYTLDNSGNRTNEQVSDASGVLASNVTRVFDNLNRVQSTTGAVH